MIIKSIQIFLNFESILSERVQHHLHCTNEGNGSYQTLLPFAVAHQYSGLWIQSTPGERLVVVLIT